MSRPERLTTRVIHPFDPDPPAEDIFSSGLESLFADTQQSHGIPGQAVIYRSPRFGDVYLQIPGHPGEERARVLFAHYLWNAGVIAAEAIERGSCDDDGDHETGRSNGGARDGGVEGVAGEPAKWDKRFWDMRGMDVLELGAATALPSLISTLSNARTVTTTDHPSSPAITMNAIESNLRINVTERGKPTNHGYDNQVDRDFVDGTVPKLHHPLVHTDTKTSVYGYTWGTEIFYETYGYGKAATDQTPLESFDRIIIADCLWMPAQHVNLVRSVLSFLKGQATRNGSVADTNGSTPCALVLAGFHTGREVVKDFIEIATGDSMGDGKIMDSGSGQIEDEDARGKLRAIDIFEVDVHGQRRPWEPIRHDETKEQSKQWCICAVLTRR